MLAAAPLYVISRQRENKNDFWKENQGLLSLPTSKNGVESALANVSFVCVCVYVYTQSLSRRRHRTQEYVSYSFSPLCCEAPLIDSHQD